MAKAAKQQRTFHCLKYMKQFVILLFALAAIVSLWHLSDLHDLQSRLHVLSHHESSFATSHSSKGNSDGHAASLPLVTTEKSTSFQYKRKSPEGCYSYNHIDAWGDAVDGVKKVQTEGECCAACQKTLNCNIW